MSFSQKIIHWYSANKRSLPWRNTTDPYKIWLSEIMLQQTRVAQGMPYYERFIEHFPTVHDLANASEEEVLKLWQGLGYYSRARNLHATAKLISEKYNGQFPDNYKGLLALKGVGDYTASAIASFCFKEAQPVVDGNVYRVLSRYFGIDLPINSTEGIKYFKALALKLMDADQIADYNQGIMEFGALQCAPKNPYCLHCPLNDSCVALQKGKIDVLPVKLKKTKVKERFFNYLVVLDKDYTIEIRQRRGRGIWQNLYEFPLLETEREYSLEEITNTMDTVLELKETSEIYQFNEKKIVHKLSHQHLHTKFWIVKSGEKHRNGVSLEELKEYPVPVLIAEFINTFKF
ncbi:adenine glycosylase [Sediminicola sp. YIK13]|uniref:A/G-specific adenine glycosylase n=1 Tax=Sediminicola sp. YIK13 TaxID=1453352 RepID=UPI000721B308|nr:A/G-specific adenine glycosylase [Sediminicola sp. YIK13]ALM08705.1 adenine glycosylase [Sediminicola sp. YIK13]